MKTLLCRWLDSLEVDDTHRFGPLHIDFLRVRPPGAGRGLPYCTLYEALSSGAAEIEETDPPRVGALRIHNASPERVFGLSGEVVRGGKQDRMLATDIVVEAGTRLDVPVTCVERDRWSRASGRIRSGTTASPSLRSVLCGSVSRSYIAVGKPASDQGAIWRTVASTGTDLGSASRTQSYSDHVESRKADIEGLLRGLPPSPFACGVAARIGSRVAVDVFDRPETLGWYRDRLVEGYAVETFALRGSPEEPPPPALGLRSLLEEATASEHPGVGLGRDVRLSSSRAHGNALVVGDIPVHLALFAG